MNDEHMLMYALVFVLGFMVARMMSGRLIEGRVCNESQFCDDDRKACIAEANAMWTDWLNTTYQDVDRDGKTHDPEKKHTWDVKGSEWEIRSTARGKIIDGCYETYQCCDK